MLIQIVSLIFICVSCILSTNKEFTNNVYNNDNYTHRKVLENCGKSFADYRIVNGDKIVQHSQPWIVRLTSTIDGSLICGGSLITTKHVLTAAHCTISLYPRQILVILGRTNFCYEYDRRLEIHRYVQEIYNHNNYDYFRNQNDIAIIKMQNPVPITKFIKPILLPYTFRHFINEFSLAIGWGQISEYGPLSCELLYAKIPIISNAKCQKLYRNIKDRITNNQICTLYEGNVPQDACQGDSGGPLIYVKNNIHVQIGIVSWGIGCARRNIPGVYTRVSRYINWIEKIIRNDIICGFIEI